MKRNLILMLFFTILFTLNNGAQVVVNLTNPLPTQCYSSSGNSVSISASSTLSGITSYSWTVAGSGTCTPTFTASASNGSIMTASFPCCGNYTISCTAYSAAVLVGGNTTNVVINCLPTVSAGLNPSTPSACIGTSYTFTPLGALTYTLMPGNLVNSSSFLVSPAAATCYTLFGSSAAGCVGQSNICLGVYPLPTVGIIGSSTACYGSNSILTASGTATSYTWDLGPTTPTISVFNVWNTCYTLTGTDANGCSNMATHCMTAVPGPTFFINGSLGTNTLCVGSGITYTANGSAAVSYTWNTNPAVISPILYVIPQAGFTQYTVNASDINGCVSTMTSNVIAYTTCAVVWPGDANRDGVVDNTDVLELGLAASSTGPARTSTSNAWAGQLASAWTGTISTGWNKCHADCNGDGLVNASDNVAIAANFSLTHTFKGPAAAGTDIQIVASGVANAGRWNKADVVLGSSTNPLSQLYGVAFDLNFDQSIIHNDSIKVVYTASFLNASNTNIDFQKAYFTNGKSYCATVRTNNSNVNGSGKIAELYYKVKTGLPANSILNLSATNAKMISAGGVLSNLTAGAPVSLTVDNNPSGFASSVLLNSTVRFYPNPASKILSLQNDLSTNTTYRIMDISGRVVMSGEFQNTKTVDVSKLAAGTYLLEFESVNGKLSKKLIIE
ncbi:MAG: T9SS type A sorting domain-containing protein [Bacteroidia bacterium]|nr:T9SS type A sorting domain-containing protein [Bacteroidia bacterium]